MQNVNADLENKKAELRQRSKTALVLLAVAVAVVWAGGVVFGFAVALLLVQMLREFAAMQRANLRSKLAVFSVLISAACCASLIYLENLGWLPIAWLACVLAATDIGAFFAGKAFGKHKIWPRISPNKTWEGAIGGFALAALVSSWFGQPAFLGAFLGIFGQVGDFSESAIKRKFGVKDSGNLLPGHGGILDRFDSYLFAAPLAALLHFAGLISW